MTRTESFLENFHVKTISLARWLGRRLIGSLPDASQGHGRLHRFILHALQWQPLLIRLAVCLTVAAIFYPFGWMIPAKLGLLAAEVYCALLGIWLVACIVRYGRPFLVAVAAMWLPILVVIVAIVLLYVNDQGQELGVGLMDPDDYHKAPFLAVTLVYWALNNWLSARIGLAKYFRKPKKEQGYLFWGPRLLGVCAHLLAALSLSFAIYFQPDPQTGIDWLLVLSAPATIVLAIIFSWSLDSAWLSRRFEGNRKYAWTIVVLSGLWGTGLWAWLGWRWYSSSSSSPQAGLTWTAFWISVSALTFLVFISKLRQKPPLGEPAEGSQEDRKRHEEERENDQRAEQSLTLFCVVFFGALMIAGTAAIWMSPMAVGQYFGSLTIACFSFGSFLALTSMVDLFTAAIAGYARSIGYRVRPRAIFGVLIALAILPGLVASLTQSFHKVRLCDGKCASTSELEGAQVPSPDERPDVAQAALAWYAQAAPAYHALHPNEPVPMFVVATAGGGIRAAYWTATVLQTLDKALGVPVDRRQKGQPENLMRNLLFAVSGVSGGSVGAAAYAAAVRNHELHKQVEVTPTDYLKRDFLAPGLAALVFIDGLANFLPDMGQIDRGEALELGFESASQTPDDADGLLSHKFLNFSPACNVPAKDCVTWRPLLLLNATHQETGRRVITSHVKVERDVFYDSYDALQVLNSDVRLSTAAHNSARFSYVSPAGNLISETTAYNRGYIIDGGYFENYGAQTALELARKAIDVIDPDHGQPNHQNLVKLVILQISSDPALQVNRTLVRAKIGDDNSCTVTTLPPKTPGSANYLEVADAVGWHTNEGEYYVLPSLNELTAPLAGIMSVRTAHGTVADDELAASICQGKNEGKALKDETQRRATTEAVERTPNGDDKKAGEAHFAHLAMCDASGIIPPLGWVLAEHTRAQFEDILKNCDNPGELKALKTALGSPEPR
jgi:Patatin-like phospholipase